MPFLYYMYDKGARKLVNTEFFSDKKSVEPRKVDSTQYIVYGILRK